MASNQSPPPSPPPPVTGAPFVAPAMAANWREGRAVRSHAGEMSGVSPRRVMILEDEPLVALELQMIVEDMGHVVTSVADNQADAVAQAARDEPDLIIADIQLRHGTGIAAAEAIFRRRKVPLIVVSGNRAPAHLAGSGYVRFLAKPFRVEALRNVIEEALAESD